MRFSFMPQTGIALVSNLSLFAVAVLATPAVQAAELTVPAGYRLSLPLMEKCAAGRTRIYERAAVDKRVKAEVKREEADDDTEVQTLDQMVRQMEKYPLMAAVMKEAGCPARDFAMLIIGLSMAGEGQGAPESIEFLKRNNARIKELNDKVEAAREKLDTSD